MPWQLLLLKRKQGGCAGNQGVSAQNHLDDKVMFKGARCLNRCNEGPFIIINGRTFEQSGIQDLEKLLEKEFSELNR